MSALQSKALVGTRPAKMQKRGRRVNVRIAAVATVWLALAITLGLAFTVGELVHATWLVIMTLAALLSPLAVIAFNRVHAKVDQLALSRTGPSPAVSTTIANTPAQGATAEPSRANASRSH
jgi:hypothetical protein